MTKGVSSIIRDISRIEAYKDQPYCIEKNFSFFAKILLLPSKAVCARIVVFTYMETYRFTRRYKSQSCQSVFSL